MPISAFLCETGLGCLDSKLEASADLTRRIKNFLGEKSTWTGLVIWIVVTVLQTPERKPFPLFS